MTIPAPSPVKEAHVTYTVELVWIANLGSMVVTVICRVPKIVKTTGVTERMVHVLHVNPDGQDYTVKQVILFTIYAIKIRIADFLIYFAINNRLSVISFCKHISKQANLELILGHIVISI